MKSIRNDLNISRLGLGTVQFGQDYGFTKEKTQKEVDAILRACLEAGINLLDTAREYGRSEEKIGRFLQQSSSQNFVVSTKLAKISPEMARKLNTLLETIVASLDTSCKLLKLQTIPLLQLHQADRYLINNSYFWEALREMKIQKRYRFFGVAVYEVSEAEGLLNDVSKIDFLQIPFNVFDQRFISVLKTCTERGIMVISRSTFLKGVMTCPIEKLPKELAGLKSYKERLAQLAKEKGLSTAELALLFVLKNPLIHSTLIGVDSPDEVRKNTAILKRKDEIDLPSKIMNELAVSNEHLIDPSQWKTL